MPTISPQYQSQSPEEYRQKIEEEILDIIEQRLIKREMNASRAKAIARLVLDNLHPHMTVEEIYQHVKIFDEHFSELARVVIEVENDHQEEMKNTVADRVRELIKNKKIEEASFLLKQTLTKDNPKNSPKEIHHE